MKKYSFLLLLTLAACGDPAKRTAGLDIDMTRALNVINLKSLRVTSSVWKVNKKGEVTKMARKEKDTTQTIKGNYALKVGDLEQGKIYEYRVKIYYKAADFEGAALKQASTNDSPPEVDIFTPSLDLCPGFNLTPDASLVQGRWLLLCEAAVQVKFKASELIEIPEDLLACDDYDADGDGMANLTELEDEIQPFNGDFDGDCVMDNLDVFPSDETESVDTDGDGVGDNADTDADNDGVLDEAEAGLGTDLLDPDSDDDGVIDGSDNCPITANSDQADVDADKKGNVCDEDSDNDGLTDADETNIYKTDPFKADTDDDGSNDKTEVTNNLSDPLDADTDDDGAKDSEDAFARNPAESKDVDGDGAGDNADNCKTVANASQSNVDTDATGDACDTDDDNDGLADTLEASIGSSPTDSDSDDDGLTDWFGGSLLAGQDPCLLTATGDHTSADADNFGAACDCNDTNQDINPAVTDTPDATGTDHNCDGIDGDPDDAIFVNGTSGDDANVGTMAAPKKTLSAAGSAASASGKDVYVADGTYTLTATYTLPSAVMFYGGFSTDFTTHDVTGTTITASTLDVLLEAADTAAGTGLAGFTLENVLATAGSPIVIEISDSTLLLANNVIVATNSAHATAISATDSTLTLTDNPIKVSAGSSSTGNQGEGISLDNVTGSFSGNDIQIEDFETRFGINCQDPGSIAITLTGNTIDVWDIPPTPLVPLAAMVYIRDCAGLGTSQHYLTADGFGLSGFTDSGGNIFDGLF
ncbi:MAG: thrombospondin type 3 repeat-containing protein [Deltaproteobacteria bacterium]|nr:thrombospondin type 3 repeat-containing protein [Deltaproteobacteria bacterium]